MPWRPLREFRDASVPKLNNLRRAADGGLRVPATVWQSADQLERGDVGLPQELGPAPWIVRSGSPTEDTHETSNAGQLLTLVARDAAEFPEALRRVVAALPSQHGRKLGAVFVQPWLRSDEAGIAFCDGFCFERTIARGGNEALTSGQERGEVTRGTLGGGDPWGRWLESVHRVFRDDVTIDIEFARDGTGFVLLQSRPALFPLRKNPTLSLTNHKEILGDPPSPWIVSVLIESGRDLSFMAVPDPAIRTWGESYAVELAARGWMNLSFWHRWMDHFGMPRATVTRNFGGTPTADERRVNWPRFLRSVPALMRFQFACLSEVPKLKRRLRQLDQTIDRAQTLPELHAAMVAGLSLALRANFSINAMLAGVLIVRRLLRVRGEAHIVTRDMMEDYRHLAERPPERREAALDEWLKRYGHRGPLESDPLQPRFAELRGVLLDDLMQRPTDPATPSAPSSWWSRLTRPFFRLEEKREWFRDELMKRWQRLRHRIREEAARLQQAGDLAAVDDVFFLKDIDLTSGRPLRERVAANRDHWQRMKLIDVPITSTKDELEQLVAGQRQATMSFENAREFRGIALTDAVVDGIVRKADDLTALLIEGGLGPQTILVVPTLEPSWAVVFPRVGGVIAEVGGEMSHASILLREVRKPALVNCTGIFRVVTTGERVRLDGSLGRAVLLDR